MFSMQPGRSDYLVAVYSVVLDINRNLACSGSMDSTVRVWNISTGQCQHTLTGHTSLVGLLGLSPSYLVSAAADSTLRVWNPDTGELHHTLAAHNGAITCFQHDEFKVLSGSDGILKMWDIRDGTEVRDLLTGIVGVWQVVFEGRWCVAASNRNDSTVLDVWDFGKEEGGEVCGEEWAGEPPGGLYDEDSEDDLDRAEADAMDEDPEIAPSEAEDTDAAEQDLGVEDEDDDRLVRWGEVPTSSETRFVSPNRTLLHPRTRFTVVTPRHNGGIAGPSVPPLPAPGVNDDTPTRPRIRNVSHRRR